MSQIAEAAEVSESTFFRYFGSKEALVFRDDFDEVLIDAFRAQPSELTPLQAMRAAIRDAFRQITPEEIADAAYRGELVMSVPELREAVAGELVETLDRLAELAAPRMGLPPDAVRVRALAGAVVGAMMAVFMVPGGMDPQFVERVDAALAELEAGFK